MKKIILAVLISLALVSMAYADLKIPPTSAGAYYSMKEHGLNHVETVGILKIKDLVSLEAGYAGDLSESDHKIIGALSLDIKQLRLSNYIKFPILDLVELRPAIFIGLGKINTQDLSGAKFDWGIGATFITLKF